MSPSAPSLRSVLFSSLLVFASPTLILVHVLILELVYTIITNIPSLRTYSNDNPAWQTISFWAKSSMFKNPLVGGVWTRNGAAGTRMSTLSCGFLAVASSRRAREVDKDAEK